MMAQGRGDIKGAIPMVRLELSGGAAKHECSWRGLAAGIGCAMCFGLLQPLEGRQCREG